MARAHELRALGAHCTVINPGAFWYSGLATGMLGGMYTPREDTVDAQALIESSGGTFIDDRVVRVDRAQRTVVLENGEEHTYDVLSFNIGSVVNRGDIECVGGHIRTVKPISNLCRLRSALERRFGGSRNTSRIVIVGGGATGCEVAANVAALARRRHARVDVLIFCRGNGILPGYPRRAATSLERALRKRGVRIHCGTTVRRIEDEHLLLDAGDEVGFDEVVLATGLAPPPLFSACGWAVSEDGGMRTKRTLESVEDPMIFGAGDCITFDGRALPKLGVFGVRQAPVLMHNLTAKLRGEALKEYEPQKRWLAILNLGDGSALAARGNLWWRGRLSMLLKDRIDRRFLRKYRRT